MRDETYFYDVIIVGGGPAGLSAAIYMARAKYKVLVIEKEKIGGQITITSQVVNYPGIEKISGRELTAAMKTQAESFGAEFMMGEVLDLELEAPIKTLYTTGGELETLGVILATGANPRILGFKGEKEFAGRGVAYCATCDGEFFTDMEIFVIGGGFAAVEEGIFLTKYAKKVTMIVREEDFTCARTVADQVEKEEKISVEFETEILEVGGKDQVSFARFRNNKDGREWVREAKEDGGFGVFVFAGYVPNTRWLSGKAACNEHGYLITDGSGRTNIDGVYGAGDVCIKNLRQVVTAVSDGAVAATSLEIYVSQIHEKLKIPQFTKKADKVKPSEPLDREGGGQEAESGESLHENRIGDGGGFLSPEIRTQLAGIFPKFTRNVVLKAQLDDSDLAGEMSVFLGEFTGLTDKVECIKENLGTKEIEEKTRQGHLLPALHIRREDGTGGNILFHGIPGGHEFNSFVIALYNMAGSGQPVDPDLLGRIKALDKKINIKVMVSLSCTMCPDVVMAAQRVAALSDGVTGQMIDLMHFPELKKKYKIMSVPCMVINDEQVYFGKKSLEELVGILEGVSVSRH